MNDTDFLKQKQRAIERMREFEKRAPGYSEPPPAFPDFVKFSADKNKKAPPEKQDNDLFGFDFGKFDIPFLDKLKNDRDLGLILGLILVLLCENTDKLTLIALVYILL